MNKKSTRTKLTDEYLEKAINTLQYVISACKAVKDGRMTWVEACQTNDLNTRNTRLMLLKNVPGCAGALPPLTELEPDNMCDGYEKCYNAIFGTRVTDKFSLPVDYEDALKQVLDGITPEYAQIIKLHFGICGQGGLNLSFEAIGEKLGLPREKVRQKEAKGICECRSRKNMIILQYGPKEYAVMHQLEEERRKQKIICMREEHDRAMEKLRKAHEKRIGEIEEDPVYFIFKECKETTIRRLDDHLSIRSVNALKRAFSIKTVYDLIMLEEKNIRQIRGIGKETLANIKDSLRTYLDTKYGMTADELREKFATLIYENEPLNPDACGACEFRTTEGCGLQEPCPYEF